MRAEMTVDLDLKTLENLRIYNGYETEKNNRKLSFEPSSPDESDTGLGEWTPSKEKSSKKSKCGRPANPIPRHKRDSHIKAEYKRRDKIQKGFDTLLTLVPELSNVSEKESKAKMLFKTADYCRRLKSESGSTQTELKALRQELESIGTEIQDLQDKLPKNGLDSVKKQDDVAMDTLYDQYVKDETKKNWKFWIFRFFMHPLYESYKKVTSGKQEAQDFNKNVFQWIQSNLSLGNLRKGFLESLRTISKHTSIMTNPEHLEQEASSNTLEHLIGTAQDSMDTNLATPTSPKVTSPSVLGSATTPKVLSTTPESSAKCTPVQTPTPTPPRTPNVSRRSSKREIQRTSISRSRSNSPAQAETEPKRRSNYRSRSGRRSCEDQEMSVEFATSSGNPNLPLLSQLLTSPHLVQVCQYRTPTTTATENTNFIQSYQANSQAPLMSHNITSTTQNKLVFNTKFLESPSSIVDTNVEMIIPNLCSGSQYATADVCSASLLGTLSGSINAEPVMIASAPVLTNSNSNNKSQFLNMEYFDSSTNESVVQSDSSSIIMDSSSISQRGCHPDSNPIDTTYCCKSQPMDLLLSITCADNMSPGMPTLINAVPEQSPCSIYSESLGNGNIARTDKLLALSPDEDSLTDLLNFDVMDVGTVMKFFSDDKQTHS